MQRLHSKVFCNAQHRNIWLSPLVFAAARADVGWGTCGSCASCPCSHINSQHLRIVAYTASAGWRFLSRCLVVCDSSLLPAGKLILKRNKCMICLITLTVAAFTKGCWEIANWRTGSQLRGVRGGGNPIWQSPHRRTILALSKYENSFLYHSTW